jgi:hypothetical protein
MKLQRLMTQDEHQRLESLEKVIEIRDSKLYRQEHRTFEDYCQTKWGWTARRSNQLIEAAGVVASLPQNGNNCSQISNEGQARELAKVEPADRPAVLEQAQAAAQSESRPMTARDIAAAAEAHEEPEPDSETESTYTDPDAHIAAVVAEEERQLNLASKSRSEKDALYHLELAREDLLVVIESIKSHKTDPAALLEAAKELQRAARMLVGLSSTTQNLPTPQP